MAKKEETISLIDTFSEFKELKNIDRTTMVSVLEESFRSVIAKMFGTDENYDVIVNPDKGDFEICNIALTYPNNWILIDSVQTVFFINLNFKLLNIVNNIKNRRPNLEDEYPKIESLFTLYEENGDDKVLIELGHEIHRSLVDIDFMSKYWFSLLDYLGYDPMPIKLYIELFKKEYPDYENMSEFLKLPVAQQNKISRKVQKKASKIYLKYRIQNFFK